MESQRHVLWNTLPNTASSPPSLSLSDESCSPSAGLTEGIQVRCRWTLSGSLLELGDAPPLAPRSAGDAQLPSSASPAPQPPIPGKH